MTEQEIKARIEQYISGRCSPEESAFLERWYADELQKRIAEIDRSDFPAVKNEIWGRIVDESAHVKKHRVAWRTWAAAVVGLLIGFFVIYQNQQTRLTGGAPK